LDDGLKFAGHGDSASPDGHAGPDRETTGCERDSVGTTCDTPDNFASVSAKRPERIVAERDFSGKHAGIESSGTSHAWHQHVASDGEPEYDAQSSNCAQRVSVRHAAGKRAGNGGFDQSSDFKPRL
jgi:hypothetical protein